MDTVGPGFFVSSKMCKSNGEIQHNQEFYTEIFVLLFRRHLHLFSLIFVRVYLQCTTRTPRKGQMV